MLALTPLEVGRDLHGNGVMRPLLIEFAQESIEAHLLLQHVHSQRSRGLFLERQMHALMPAILLWTTWPDALDRYPNLSHQTGGFDRLLRSLGEAKRRPLSLRLALGKQPAKGCKDARLFCRFEGFAGEK